jgi:taurine dioxygenase
MALIDVRPLDGALGAEIGGIDLSGPLTDAAIAEVRRAFLEHLVIFFRGQDLTPAHQLAFARRFGAIGLYPFAQGMEGTPEIMEVIKEPEQATNFGGFWHSDTAYLEKPPLGSMLYAVEVPPGRGDTLFANMTLAYEKLTAETKAEIDGLSAYNTAAKDKGRVRGDHLAGGAMKGRAEKDLAAWHPVVRIHPETGRPSLYVNRAHTVRFEGMTEDESAPLLERLCDHATAAEFTCRFRWEPGSLAFWDNRCTQHYPLNDYPGFRRIMHRVTIEGKRPLGGTFDLRASDSFH